MIRYFELGPWLVLMALIALTVVFRWLLNKAAPKDDFQRVVCARYSIFAAFVILALPLISGFILPGSLYGLFVLDAHDAFWEGAQFALLTFASYLAALMVTSTYRVTMLNAHDRLAWIDADRLRSTREFDTTPIAGGTHPPFPCVAFILLGSWNPAWAAGFTINEYYRGADVFSHSWSERLVEAGAGIGAGLVFTFLFLVIALFVQWSVIPDFVDCRLGLLPWETWLPPLQRQSHRLTRRYWAFLARLFNGPGYTQTTPGGKVMFAPGHAQLMVVMASWIVIYASLYWLGPPAQSVLIAQACSSLFYVLVIVIILGFALAGLTFAVDTYRVPPLLIAIIIVACLHLFSENAGHYFELQSTSAEVGKSGPIALHSALEGWALPKGPGGGGTLVIVAAAGGGIQASAWTAQVLTGLDALFSDFSESIVLVSGVSGGSVGSMYYMACRGDRTGNPALPMRLTKTTRDRIIRLASSSSLEATAWGSAFPDLIRFVFPPAIVNPLVDRGTTIQSDWQSKIDPLGGFQDSLRHWGSEAQRAHKPIVAFNSTLAESGEHLVMASVVCDEDERYFQFLRSYPPNLDLGIATAARLSATFSYVSPICKPFYRPAPTAQKPGASVDDTPALRWRVADGGYFDNDGIVVTTKWADNIVIDELTTRQTPRFKDIIILRIVAFPENKKTEGGGGTATNFLWDVLGPVFCLNAARGGAQTERSDWETAILTYGILERLYQHRQEMAKTQLSTLPEGLPEVGNIKALIEAPTVDTQKVNDSRSLIRRTVDDILKKRPKTLAAKKRLPAKNENTPDENAELENLLLAPIVYKPGRLSTNPESPVADDDIRIWSLVIRPPKDLDQPEPPLS